MEPTSETVGFIDVGTNSIHLLVMRFYQGALGTPIYQDKESVRLGRSVYTTGMFDEDSIAKSSLVISRFASISRNLGASKVMAFATSAMREASNSQSLIDSIEGAEIRIIPGSEEARLISLGVFGEHGPEKATIGIDIGGGSTEIYIRDDGKDVFLDSLSMGAVRYNYNMGIDFSSQVSREDYSHILRTVDISSYHAVATVGTIRPELAVGSSGTLIALAEVCAWRRGDGDASYLDLKELQDLMRRLCAMTAEEREKVPGISKNRSDIIIPGGAIAEELMSQFGIQRMSISQNGLKQGMMLDYHISKGGTSYDVRESSVRSLAGRCHYDRGHAEQVERNAMAIYDQLSDLGLIELDGKWRNLLSCSAILHDIGELISYSNHHVLSQMIIENADLQGFSCDEIRFMGLIVRSHHKKFPSPKDERFEGIRRSDVDAIRRCSIVLKMADVLDRHRNGSVKRIELRMMGGELQLRIRADSDPAMEMWSMEKVTPDFQKVFGCDLVCYDDSRK